MKIEKFYSFPYRYIPSNNPDGEVRYFFGFDVINKAAYKDLSRLAFMSAGVFNEKIINSYAISIYDLLKFVSPSLEVDSALLDIALFISPCDKLELFFDIQISSRDVFTMLIKLVYDIEDVTEFSDDK